MFRIIWKVCQKYFIFLGILFYNICFHSEFFKISIFIFISFYVSNCLKSTFIFCKKLEGPTLHSQSSLRSWLHLAKSVDCLTNLGIPVCSKTLINKEEVIVFWCATSQIKPKSLEKININMINLMTFFLMIDKSHQKIISW